ncbi:MAG: SGNH/GDSL hydrolase family protein [Aeromicrobium sp.]
MGTRRQVVSALVVLVSLTACSPGSDGGSDDVSPPATATTGAAPTTAPAAAGTATSYVALGDSFTVGPGIGDPQQDAGFCQRSTANWPSLVAAANDLALTDLSCVGATTADLASTLASGVLDASPRYVTVSTGGNDSALFTSLITSCAGGQGSCASFVEGQVPDILARTTSDIAALLTEVQAEVPDARVLLVGYPRIAPETGGCDTIGIPDSSSVLAAETALDASLAEAAERSGTQYVSLRADSLGHDACSGTDAWTNGRTAAPGDGIGFHPTARGMEAIAGIVARAAEQPG